MIKYIMDALYKNDNMVVTINATKTFVEGFDEEAYTKVCIKQLKLF
jgi:hypothetical protein